MGIQFKNYPKGSLIGSGSYQFRHYGEEGPQIVSWATGTDEQIMAMIEADRAGLINLQDYWSVGETRSITLSAMSATGVSESHASQIVEFVLMDSTCKGFSYTTATASGRTTPRFIVGQKNCLKEVGELNSMWVTNGWKPSVRRTWCNATYKNAFPSSIIGAFKQFTWKTSKGGSASSGLYETDDYFGLPLIKAVIGAKDIGQGDEADCYLLWSYYSTSSNRIKTVNGSASDWWTASARRELFYMVYVNSSGTTGSTYCSSKYGIAPFGVI